MLSFTSSFGAKFSFASMTSAFWIILFCSSSKLFLTPVLFTSQFFASSLAASVKFFTFSYSFLPVFARFIRSLMNFSTGFSSFIAVCTSMTLSSLLMLNLPFLIVSLPSMSALLSIKLGVTIFILLPSLGVSRIFGLISKSLCMIMPPRVFGCNTSF